MKEPRAGWSDRGSNSGRTFSKYKLSFSLLIICWRSVIPFVLSVFVILFTCLPVIANEVHGVVDQRYSFLARIW
jgi:hypothetical protein